MYNPFVKSFDVTAVCTLYKRPESLVKQIKALEQQTLKPKKIILFQDGVASNYRIELLEEFKQKFACIYSSEQNVGVWERFRFALNKADTSYICVFDDDTIPGERWLENCHFHMMKQKGIYGTNGIVMTDKLSYPLGGYFPVGWKGPVSECTEVDFVGHSWFMPEECLKYMFDGTEEYQKMKYAAEDMCLSVKAKQNGIRTFVPPHPSKDKTLWGSTPIFGNLFGNAVEALSFNVDNLEMMQKAITEFEQDGWEPLCIKEAHLIKQAKANVKVERKRNFWFRVKQKIKRDIFRR